MKPILQDKLLQSIIQVISEQTGLNIGPKDVNKFNDIVFERIRLLSLSSPEDYYHLLESGRDETKIEWKEFIIRLTPGETYFLRDKGQFLLLRKVILPELIHVRKTKQSLRLWSAGCSTGEEAYSLAILVNELLPKREDWDILILGTDINEAALRKAIRGSYGQWSFRMVEQGLQRQYFEKTGDEWEINKRIKGMVKFGAIDLQKDTYPDYASEIHNMDLILCRNVFIYYNPDVVSKIVNKLEETLRDGGYLMTGHAEVNLQKLGKLRPRVFPESVIYRKFSELEMRTMEFKPKIPAAKPETKEKPKIQIPEFNVEEERKIHNHKSKIETAESLLKKGDFPLAIEKAKQVIDENPRHFDAHYIAAHAYANMGEYGKTVYHCQQAINIDPLNPGPYYLLGQIAREKGDIEREKEMLKKVIYLSPSHVAAYLELGIIYENEGEVIKAKKMRRHALEILRKLPKDTRIEPYREFSAGEMVKHVEEIVK